jgi:hypothetical protein
MGVNRLWWWTIAFWMGSYLGASAQNADGIYVLRDLLKEWANGRLENALSKSEVKSVESGNVRRTGAFLHPTDKPARMELQISLPPVSEPDHLVLLAWGGVDDNVPRDDVKNPHDGVRFGIEVEGQRAYNVNCLEPGWVPLSADLTPFAGKTVRLVFTVDKRENSNYDWAYIAEPQIVRLRDRFGKFVGSSLPPEGVLEMKGAPGKPFILKPEGANIPSMHLTHSGQEGQAVWVRYRFPGAKSVQLTRDPGEGTVRVYGFSPRLRLQSVSSNRALLAPNETADVVATVQNIGFGTYAGDDLQLSLIPQKDASLLTRPTVESLVLPPGEQRTFRFRVRVGKDPRILVQMSSRAGSDAIPMKMPVAEFLSSIPTGNLVKQLGIHWVLQNESLRLVISPSNNSTVARLFGKSADTWQLLAVASPLAEGVLNVEGGPPKQQTFRMASTAADEPGNRLILRGSMGPIGQVTVEYRLNDTTLDCYARLSSSPDAHLYLFRFPDWRLGDGSFGENKTEAILPGLEYLGENEPSSNSSFAAPPHHLRVASHPYKITMPLMSVRWRTWLLTMIWDPLQTWSGSSKTPNVLFASPNFIEEQSNHRMALWVPALPRWANENALQANQPLRVIKDQAIVLRAQLNVRSNSQTMMEGVEWLVQQRGMPQPPAPQRTDEPALLLTISGLLISWDVEQRAWRHTNTGPVYYDPAIVLPLWVLAHRPSTPEQQRAPSIEQVRAAVERQAKHAIGWEPAFYIGGLPSVLTHWHDASHALVKNQRADGSWAWQPPSERHKIFGKAGDTSSGHTGQHASQLGQAALVLQDPQLWQAFMKAAMFLEKQTRPEGAQTWELSLHVPDILASAHCVNVFLTAYQQTGDKKYLERARYWALTGLPFVYFWNAPDRPIMRGATIPVFGVTWLSQQAWFGVAVQWCGLVYARSLFRLSEHENTPDWRKLAEAITLSAVQQQELITARYPSDIGMYPDAYSIVKGDEEYHWDLNPRLIAPNLAQRLGFTLEPRTLILREPTGNQAITAPGLKSAKHENNTLQATLEPPFNLPAVYMVVSGHWKSAGEKWEVQYNGQTLSEVEDMDLFLWQKSDITSGWWYDNKHGWLVIRLMQPGLRSSVMIRGSS